MKKRSAPETPEQVSARRHAWYLKNAEKVKARVRKYNRENKEKIKAANKKRRLRDPQKTKAKARANYIKNRQRILDSCHRYHARNRVKLLEKMRAKYHEQADYRKARQIAYYAKNREARRAYASEYARKNKQKVNDQAREYRQKNLDRVRAYDRLRAASPTEARKAAWKLWRLKNRERIRTYWNAANLKVIIFLGGKCATCGWNEDPSLLETDHVVSFSKRGLRRPRTRRHSDIYKDPTQFQVLCPNCHAIKCAIEQMSERENKAQRARARIVKKFGSACKLCGYDKNHLAFHFDHIIPINGIGRSSATHHVPKYGERFQLLCKICHRKKTRKEGVERANAKLQAALKAAEVAGS